jgi:hypothetical protein
MELYAAGETEEIWKKKSTLIPLRILRISYKVTRDWTGGSGICDSRSHGIVFRKLHTHGMFIMNCQYNPQCLFITDIGMTQLNMAHSEGLHRHVWKRCWNSGQWNPVGTPGKGGPMVRAAPVVSFYHYIHVLFLPVFPIHIVAYLLKARNVEPEKQPWLSNGYVTRKQWSNCWKRCFLCSSWRGCHYEVVLRWQLEE